MVSGSPVVVVSSGSVVVSSCVVVVMGSEDVVSIVVVEASEQLRISGVGGPLIRSQSRASLSKSSQSMRSMS